MTETKMTLTNVKGLIDHVESECDALDRGRLYDDMLDECYSFESVGGIFSSMSPSRVLKECDPTAYRCGMNDYFGSGDEYFEIGSELYRCEDVEKAREEFIEGIDNQISELEIEIEEAEADGDFNVSRLAGMKRTLADLQHDSKEATDHVF